MTAGVSTVHASTALHCTPLQTVGRRTGDAQVGLASSVHGDDAQADGGCSSSGLVGGSSVLGDAETRCDGAALRARRCAGLQSAQETVAEGSSRKLRAAGCWLLAAWVLARVAEEGVAEHDVARVELTKAPPPLC